MSYIERSQPPSDRAEGPQRQLFDDDELVANRFDDIDAQFEIAKRAWLQVEAARVSGDRANLSTAMERFAAAVSEIAPLARIVVRTVTAARSHQKE